MYTSVYVIYRHAEECLKNDIQVFGTSGKVVLCLCTREREQESTGTNNVRGHSITNLVFFFMHFSSFSSNEITRSFTIYLYLYKPLDIRDIAVRNVQVLPVSSFSFLFFLHVCREGGIHVYKPLSIFLDSYQWLHTPIRTCEGLPTPIFYFLHTAASQQCLYQGPEDVHASPHSFFSFLFLSFFLHPSTSLYLLYCCTETSALVIQTANKNIEYKKVEGVQSLWIGGVNWKLGCPYRRSS